MEEAETSGARRLPYLIAPLFSLVGLVAPRAFHLVI